MGSKLRLVQLDPRAQHVKDAFARNRSRNPDQRKLRSEPAVKVEHDLIRSQEERQACAHRIAGVISDVKPNGEIAVHGALKADPQE